MNSLQNNPNSGQLLSAGQTPQRLLEEKFQNLSVELRKRPYQSDTEKIRIDTVK